MEPFSAYLPLDRRHALARDLPLPGATRGAVLFADIAGFTPLTATLAQELGVQRGAEELNRRLNAVYRELIGRVHAYRGSVVHFSGDSITCWFDDKPSGDEVASDGARRALACAATMQQAMAGFKSARTPGNTIVSMALKIAVTAGSARRFLVGDPSARVIEILAGNLLDRMAAAERAARPGEIVVGAEILSEFGPDLSLQEWRPGEGGGYFAVVDATAAARQVQPTPWPEIALPEETPADQWALAVLRQRLRESPDAFVAELRQSVAFFLTFAGIDFDGDEEAGKKLDEYVRWIQGVLTRFEGQLIQITTGDKGNYLYIIFGAPIAHEDDPARAVATAEALLAVPDHLQFIEETSIGISQGLLYVGPYGAPNRRTFGAIGNETNIAARLMEQGQAGQVVVSAQVARGTEHLFFYNSLGSVHLKGVEKSVPIYTLAGRRQRPAESLLKGRSLTPLIGREREREALAATLESLQQGEGRTVIIEGEAGIGKSRLVMAYLEQVREAGLPLLLGSGSAIESATAYHAWRPLFRDIFAIEDDVAPRAAREQVLAYLAREEDLLPLVPLLNAVLPVHLPENERTAQMAGEARAASTRDLLCRLLGRAYRDAPGIVLVFEDAQWLDSASWALLRQVRRNISPLAVVIASRPDALAEETQGLNGVNEVQRLRIGALSPEETEVLVRHRLGVEELPESVADFIQRQAEGHPFFSEEIAFALRDAGYLNIRGNRSYLSDRVTTLQELDFPATIQGVITSRIDRLAADQQLTLKAASVIGRIFALRALTHVFPLADKRDELPLYLEMLATLDIILPELPEPELAYIFKHSITQDVVYNLMTYAQRRQLHRTAARWYERRYADDLSAHYGLLAHHWIRADESDKALDYLEKAGRQALRNFANAEAVTFFSQALALDAKSRSAGAGRRAQWELLLGEAYVYWTRYEDGRKHLEEGLRLLGEPVPQARAPVHVAGAVARQLAHRAWPRSLATAGEQEREQLLLASRAYSRLVEVYYHFGEVALSTYAAFHALNLAERAGDSPELAEAYAPIASFFSFLRRHGMAQAYFRRALETAERVESLPALAYVRLVHVTYNVGIGNWGEAETGIEQLGEIGAQLGAPRRLNDSLQMMAILQYMRGDFRGALASAARLLESARRLNDLRFQGYALYAMAYSHFALGETEKAHGYLAKLEPLLGPGKEVTDEQLLLNLHGLAAAVYLRQGEMEAALAAAGRALTLTMGSFQSGYYTLPGYVGPVSVYLAHWRAAPADGQRRQRARKALRALSQFASTFTVGRPRAALFWGDFYEQDGARRRAVRQWQQALATAEVLSMSYEAGEAHLRLGRYPLDGQTDAEAHLQAALDHFEAVGAQADLAQARAALEELGKPLPREAGSLERRSYQRRRGSRPRARVRR